MFTEDHTVQQIQIVKTKTQDELQALKENWLYDPCWDIENTDGFEAHYGELLAFRLFHEEQQKEEREAEIKQKALMLDCSEATAKYIIKLESAINTLKSRLEKLENE